MFFNKKKHLKNILMQKHEKLYMICITFLHKIILVKLGWFLGGFGEMEILIVIRLTIDILFNGC